MTRKPGLSTILFAAVLSLIAGTPTRPTKAEESAGARYTLFNPVPDDQLRQMSTDRPNITNAPQTVDAGHAQIEEGFLDYARARSDKLSPYKAFFFGRTNIRVGLLDNLEVNAAIDSYDVVWNTEDGSGRSRKQSGVGDTVIGGKLNLWGNEGSDAPWSTALAVQPQLKLPTARSSIGNRHTEFSLGIPFSISLIDDFHLGLQTSVADLRNQANTGYVTGWQNSASLDRVFFDRFDVYLEYAARVTTDRHVGSLQTIDLGVVYAVTSNLTLDTGLNLGLNSTSPKTEWLAGASFRF